MSDNNIWMKAPLQRKCRCDICLTAVLSLTHQSPYMGKTVFMLRRAPGTIVNISLAYCIIARIQGTKTQSKLCIYFMVIYAEYGSTKYLKYMSLSIKDTSQSSIDWLRRFPGNVCVFSYPGPRLNIKTVLSTYGDFHVKDKTAVRTSYL